MRIKPEDVDVEQAAQMFQVGVIPSDDAVIGEKVILAGQPCVVLEEVTRDQFFGAVLRAGFRVEPFREVPQHFRFFRISTD